MLISKEGWIKLTDFGLSTDKNYRTMEKYGKKFEN